jgi:GAF domain-containing protein
MDPVSSSASSGTPYLEGGEVAEDVRAAEGLGDEVEQLRRDLAEAPEQQAATSGVLAALGRAASDLDAVLETVVDSARRLCRADVGLIFLLESAGYRLAFSSGILTEENRAYLAQHPLAPDRGTLAGRVGLERRPQQIADVLADPEYGRPDLQRLAGFRTTMGVPCCWTARWSASWSSGGPRSSRSASAPSSS